MSMGISSSWLFENSFYKHQIEFLAQIRAKIKTNHVLPNDAEQPISSSRRLGCVS